MPVPATLAPVSPNLAAVAPKSPEIKEWSLHQTLKNQFGNAPIVNKYAVPAPAKQGAKASGLNKDIKTGAGIEDLNGTMFQTFHWWSANDAQHWNALKAKAPELAKLGITSLWMPPFGKGGSGVNDVGYAVFDLYDLGEFDQKGGKPTKYGTKEELVTACKALKEHGIRLYADIVYNQRQGGQEREEVQVQEWNPQARNQPLGEPFTAYVWSNFGCKGEAKYAPEFPTTKEMFDTVGWIETKDDKGNFYGREGIFTIMGRTQEGGVSEENENYDFLCACDTNLGDPRVYEYLKKHLEWLLNELPLDGLRLDAVKHMDSSFYRRLIPEIRAATGKDLFVVGEHYSNDVASLDKYLIDTDRQMSLFDFPLRQNFVNASQGSFDLRTLFDGTLVEAAPWFAVPFVDNHDLQPLRVPDSAQVKPWFRPHAHAAILLRKDGYPCVFVPDVYGATYSSTEPGTDRVVEVKMEPVYGLPEMLAIRATRNYGPIHDFIKFDDLNCEQPNPSADVIAWTREGIDSKPGSGLAVVLSKSEEVTKHLYVGTRHAKTKFVHFIDATRTVDINEQGYGDFKVYAGECAVYIPQI